MEKARRGASRRARQRTVRQASGQTTRTANAPWCGPGRHATFPRGKTVYPSNTLDRDFLKRADAFLVDAEDADAQDGPAQKVQIALITELNRRGRGLGQSRRRLPGLRRRARSQPRRAGAAPGG